MTTFLNCQKSKATRFFGKTPSAGKIAFYNGKGRNDSSDAKRVFDRWDCCHGGSDDVIQSTCKDSI